MGTNGSQAAFTRRSFLKTTGATAATAMIAGTTASTLTGVASAQAESEGSEERVCTCVCTGNCGGSCAMQVHVRDGKAVDITPQPYPDPDLEQVCQRGLAHIQRIYDPRRLKYPMRRVGERGSGEWERISWDEAIDEICEKWKGYQKEFGDRSIVFFPGSGNLRADASGTGYANRLINYMGACFMNNGYDNNAMFTIGAMMGNDLCFLGNDWRDLRNANNIFIWGTNITESAGVRWHWLKDAMEAGAHTVVIDPNFTTVAGKADEYVSVRPGSDGLLAIAMMQIIVDEGLVDFETLVSATCAPYLVGEDGKYLRVVSEQSEKGASSGDILVMDSLEGAVPLNQASSPMLEGTFEVDGVSATTAYSLLLDRIKEWDISDIVERCGISEEKIRELALRYADGPTTIMTGYGPDHYVNGITFYANICALAMVSGNIQKPGTGISGASIGSLGAVGSNVAAITTPADAKGMFTIYSPYFPELMETGLYGDQEMDVKSLYLWVHNPLGNQPERQAWLRAFEKVEFIVLADVYMTESAKYADIVLPVPHYFEVESFQGGNTYIRVNEAAVEPPYECKSDFDIINLLGQGMGFKDEFGMSLNDFCTAAFENATAKTYGLTWERVKREKMVKAFPDGYYVHGQNGFKTTTGKAQFYIENVKPQPDLGGEWDQAREALPYWEPPREAWYENELFKTYPLVFTTERAKFKVHTQFTYVPELLELDPEPYVKMSSQDASDRGVSTGDVVRIHNDRGYVVCKAVVSAGTRPGVVVMDHGWQDEQFIEGHYNDLSSVASHKRFPSGCWFDGLVEIEKIG
ncbi:molybdopterin-containing oxidoreductase family protein [Rubneribacter sp.]